jgi:hypothetical protein
MKINRWICWLKTVWRSIQVGWPLNYPMCGCDFVDMEEHKNCTVTITRCEICGKKNICWSSFN